MAARKDLRHTLEVRRKIQTSQLVNRLQNNALGKLAKPMTAAQVRSAEVVLRKSLADMKQESRPIVLKNWDSSASAADQSKVLLQAVATGDISPDDGAKLIGALNVQTQIEKLAELEQQIEQLREQLARR